MHIPAVVKPQLSSRPGLIWLSRDAIWNASLGYNAGWRETAPGCRLAPGIVIPCMVDGQLWPVKVRTTGTARAAAVAKGKRLGKCAALKGGVTGALFNARGLRANPDASGLGACARQTAIVVEGEFDALLLGQFLPPGWTAVTMGSTGMVSGLAFRPYLAPVEVIRLALDGDEAEQTGRAA